jgi:plastocyanin
MFVARVLTIAALVGTVACSSEPTTPSPDAFPRDRTAQSQGPGASIFAVTIQDFSFSPTSLTIKAGTSVRWTNNGPSDHTTTSDTGIWDSGTFPAGASFTVTFSEPGIFPYHCAIHPPNLFPGFVGTVTVTE